ncbi:MAG: RidA family protein [Woeseiaceae bacterium]
MRILVLVSLVTLGSIAGAQEIERINPQGLTQPTAYSHLVKHGELLFIAGQVALDDAGNVIGEGDMTAQYRQVLENMKTVLASEGADFSDVVKITIFTTDIDEFRKAGSLRSEYFGDSAPASTLVQIERLARPVFLVEIEAIAIKP